MSKEEKLDWIYKGANSLVDREEYLLGRKVDKTLDQLNNEEKETKFVLPTPKNHVEHECIPPSIRDFNKIVQAEQVDLQTKLQEDPLIAIKKREEEARRQFLQNPVQLKKLQEALMKKQNQKKKTKKKSKKKDLDLDEKIKQKLKMLKSKTTGPTEPRKDSKKEKDETLTTILMHKFNALKSKLSEDDLQDILNGKTSDSSDSENEDKSKKKSHRKSQSSDSEEEVIRNKEKEKYKKRNKRRDSSHHDKRERSSSRETYNLGKNKRTRRSRSPRTTEKYRSEKSYQGNQKSSGQRRYRSRSKSKESELRKKKQRSRSRDQEKKSRSRDRERSKNTAVKRRNESTDSSDDEKSYHHQKSTPKGSDSDSELDKKIMAQLKILRGEAENQLKTKKPLYPEKPSNLYKNSKSSSSSSEDSESDTKQHSRKSSSPAKAKYKYSDHEEEIPKQKSFGLVSADGKKIAFKNTSQKSKNSKPTKKIEETSSKPVFKNVKKMSEEEKERLRKEMMKNAKSRDKEREENIRLYREKNKKEEETVSKSFDADLVHNELMKSANHSSVEQRIKSKLNSIQRSSRHMESNFSKR
ncbi:pre-mRNA-splicing factor CWC25 homolog [Anthonomus grandis grandis]|uniref:pre-mRNA-splicing factor CWC25 homolog n=1 Tax=Anthonomus grandis grandis TaxID=2921223 RepID=UPI0021651AEE|nr:pre-mRNA-splicing factor CWC25 homolog [Anthonomus grandis grandis]